MIIDNLMVITYQPNLQNLPELLPPNKQLGFIDTPSLTSSRTWPWPSLLQGTLFGLGSGSHELLFVEGPHPVGYTLPLFIVALETRLSSWSVTKKPTLSSLPISGSLVVVMTGDDCDKDGLTYPGSRKAELSLLLPLSPRLLSLC